MKKGHSQQSATISISPVKSFLDHPGKLFLLFFGACLLLFGNSIKNKYSLDDEFVTYNNPQVMKGFKAIPEIFTSRYVMDGEKAKYGYRPIVKVSFAIENQLFGQNPHIGHFINIVLYALVCVVLYLFLRRILREHTAAFSFWIVVLFLFHPFHNEVVVSLKNRDALFSLLFGLISMNAALDALSTKRVIFYFKWLLFYALAMLSKTDVLTFLFLIPFTAWFFEKAELKRILLFTGCMILVFIAVKLTIGSLLSSVGNKRDFVFIENPLFFTEGMMPRITGAFASFWFYVTSMMFPFKLLSYYGYNTIEVLKWDFQAIAGMIITAGFILYFILRFKKRDVVYYGLLFFCVSSSMFINLVKPAVGVVAERFMFVPSVGFCIAVIALLYKAFKISSLSEKQLFPKTGFVALTLGLCLVFSFQGIARNPDWYDHLTLYKADSEKCDESAKLHALVAANLIKEVVDESKGNRKASLQIVKQAVLHYQRSLEIYPDYITSLNNLGMIYQSYLKKHSEAAELLKKAVKLDPEYVEAWANLGTAQLSMKDTVSAISSYKNALVLKPGFIMACNSLSAALTKQRKYDEVLAMNNDALKLEQNAAYYMNIGRVYFHQGDTLTGISFLEKASNLDRSNQALNKFLFGYFYKKGESSKANEYQIRYNSSQR